MAITDTSNTICNEALALMGNNSPQVSGEAPNFDNSPAGIAAKNLYTSCVAAVARSFEYDFARTQVALDPTGNSAPFALGFTHEYFYPPLAVEIWQIVNPFNTDENNPLPTNWSVGNTITGSGANQVQSKVIWTTIGAAKAVLNNNPLPQVWDSLFREAVVQRLASEFAMALAGRPETEDNLMRAAGQTAGIAMSRDG